MKPIRFTFHTKSRMLVRGATEEEIFQVIRFGRRQPAKKGKIKSKIRFDYNKEAPTNQKFYKYKTIEPIFIEKPEEILVITVKVYYSN